VGTEVSEKHCLRVEHLKGVRQGTDQEHGSKQQEPRRTKIETPNKRQVFKGPYTKQETQAVTNEQLIVSWSSN